MRRHYSEDQETPSSSDGHSKTESLTESLTITNRRERVPPQRGSMLVDANGCTRRDEILRNGWADLTEKLVRMLSKVVEMLRSVVVREAWW
ncbi:MAG: hypothetical protein NNA23_02470 [Nitrospira sp.]|nr:hypothetical protein [Nitrospira sp.]